jgi:hypothetical protein
VRSPGRPGRDHLRHGLGATQLNASTPVPGTFVYTQRRARCSRRGRTRASRDLHAERRGQLHDGHGEHDAPPCCRSRRPISWPTPASITYGTPLSADAVECVDGGAGHVCVYPAAGACWTRARGHCR